MTKTIVDCGSINLGLLLSTGKASLGKLCLLSIRLESALSIQTSTVDIHLPFITADSILVETIELRGAFPTIFTSPTHLIQELGSIPYYFGRFARDFWLEVEFFCLLMGFHRPLEVDYLVTTLSVIDEKLFCWGVTIGYILPSIISRWLESVWVDLGAQLLTPCVSQFVLQLFSLLKPSSVESFAIVRTL